MRIADLFEARYSGKQHKVYYYEALVECLDPRCERRRAVSGNCIFNLNDLDNDIRSGEYQVFNDCGDLYSMEDFTGHGGQQWGKNRERLLKDGGFADVWEQGIYSVSLKGMDQAHLAALYLARSLVENAEEGSYYGEEDLLDKVQQDARHTIKEAKYQGSIQPKGALLKLQDDGYGISGYWMEMDPKEVINQIEYKRQHPQPGITIKEISRQEGLRSSQNFIDDDVHLMSEVQEFMKFTEKRFGRYYLIKNQSMVHSLLFVPN